MKGNCFVSAKVKLRNNVTGLWFKADGFGFTEPCMLKAAEIPEGDACVVAAEWGSNFTPVTVQQQGSMYCECDACADLEEESA